MSKKGISTKTTIVLDLFLILKTFQKKFFSLLFRFQKRKIFWKKKISIKNSKTISFKTYAFATKFSGFFIMQIVRMKKKIPIKFWEIPQKRESGFPKYISDFSGQWIEFSNFPIPTPVFQQFNQNFPWNKFLSWASYLIIILQLPEL